jgi:uncharacterized protein
MSSQLHADLLPIIGLAAMLAVGLSLGIIGGGGSILAVPILVSLFGIRPSTATGYSLLIVGLGSLAGSYSYFRRKEVELKIALLFSIPSFIAIFITRRFLVASIPNVIYHGNHFEVTKDALTLILFASLMLAVSMRMLRNDRLVDNAFAGPARLEAIPLIGLAVGLVAGLIGVGGGFMIVPPLVLLAGLPTRRAVGTSLLIIGIQSLFGFTGELGTGQLIPWGFLSLLGGVTILGVSVGSWLGRNLSGKQLRSAFAWMVIAVGLATMGQGISNIV